jgi:sugar phosphate isomerase/epimerase
MIRLSTVLRLGIERPELEQLVRNCAALGIHTICGATQLEWSDEAVMALRRYLDAAGLRIGELSRFHHGLASADPEAYRAALEAYRRHLAHAAILDATCVGFSFSGLYNRPDVRSPEVWDRCIRATEALARAAEEAGIDIAAHPHLIGPLYSAERLRQLLAAVASPRVKVLLDPVNLVTPDTYFDTTALVHSLFDTLGTHVVAVHAKDVSMSGLRRNERGRLSVCHLDEELPGEGVLDYATLLRRLHNLNRDVVLNVEHLASLEEAHVALAFVRSVASQVNVPLV